MSVYLGSNKIGSSIFKNNAKMGKLVEGSLEEITAEDFEDVYFVYDYKFAYSQGLKKVSFNTDVYEIGMESFSNCDNLQEVLNFVGGVVGDSAFYFCSKLENIELKNPSTHIGGYAFRGCSLGNSIVEDIINNKSFTIGRNAFVGCKNITKLNLTFDNYQHTVFENIEENNNVYMISGIEIPQNLFQQCENLEEICLGTNVAKINSGVFSECNKLKKMTIMAQFPPKIESGNGFLDNVYNHPIEVIYIPKGTIDRYKNANYWNYFSDIFVEME